MLLYGFFGVMGIPVTLKNPHRNSRFIIVPYYGKLAYYGDL